MRRDLVEVKVLEDAASAFHSGRVFLVTNAADFGCGVLERGSIAGTEAQTGGEDHPLFVALENAFAISEVALLVAERHEAITGGDRYRFDNFLYRTSVGSGIAVDCATKFAGYAGHGVHAFEAFGDTAIDDVLQDGSGFDVEDVAFAADLGAGEAENDAVESRVRDDQVGAAADYDQREDLRAGQRERASECRLVGRLAEKGSWSANGKAGELCEGYISQYLKVGNRRKIFVDCGRDWHFIPILDLLRRTSVEEATCYDRRLAPERMKFFLDSANLDELRRALTWGIIDGVTTNPSLIAKEGVPIQEQLRAICDLVDGDVSAPVLTSRTREMVVEARRLVKIKRNVVVKVPMTEEGIKAVAVLRQEDIRTNVTLCFTPGQALIAAKAGAAYVSPFYARVEDAGGSGADLIRDILKIYANYGLQTQVLAASLRGPAHVIEAAKAGAHVATLPYKIIESLFAHPLTERGLEQFMKDYSRAFELAAKA